VKVDQSDPDDNKYMRGTKLATGFNTEKYETKTFDNTYEW
jgi:hypothetical protein